MADLLLREAVEQMRAHLRAGHFSDAFALGQHILHSFPKHIETYTILAQASLETNDLASATDLFRRVLSADPENVVALAGMALISEGQDKYDEALWYLERAFEIQPANDQLRGELLRLREIYYGTAPARLELTSGALARSYARQGQYAQAVNEFRRLLRNDSKRYDVRVALAETLYRAGRTDEAAQVAQQVMADAPYSLKPNLILGALWTENAVPEGQQFLQRAHQLDPEHRVARDLLGDRFDGIQQPRLPAFGERGMPTLATSESAATDEALALDEQTLRAAELLRGIELAQEADEVMQEPLTPQLEALEAAPEEAVEVQADSDSPPAETPQSADSGLVIAAALAAGIAIGEHKPDAPVSEPTAEPTLDATLLEIAEAEELQTVEEPPPTAVPAILAAPQSGERATKSKKEPISPEAIAAAAAALATSIALDKANQPSPTLRAHPAIPKVRPVVRGAADRLPTWLRLGTPPANAPASFDDTAEPGATTSEPDRPDWLVQAQAASVQESISPPTDAGLPDWLKPAAVGIAAKQVVESTALPQDVPAETQQGEKTPVSSIPAGSAPPAATAGAAASVIAMPEWLTDKPAPQPQTATTVQDAPALTEGWTNAPDAQAGGEVTPRQLIEQEPPPVRAEVEADISGAAEISQDASPVADSRIEAALPIIGAALAAQAVSDSPPPVDQSVMIPDVPQETTAAATEEAMVTDIAPATDSTAAQVAPVTAVAAENAVPADDDGTPAKPAQAMPDSATMLQMARDKRDNGDLKGALDLYERVMHRRPNHLEQVTADLEEIVRAGGAPTSANRLLGEAYAMAGRFKESLEQYRIAMGK